MGRRGYVQVRQPEYGDTYVQGDDQHAAYAFLERKGINVIAGDTMCNAEDADHWEVEIPTKHVNTYDKNKDIVTHEEIVQYDKAWKIVRFLREHPRSVSCSAQLADLLEEGLKAAEKRKYGVIAIDWF